jgi:hypothetical protein
LRGALFNSLLGFFELGEAVFATLNFFGDA